MRLFEGGGAPLTVLLLLIWNLPAINSELPKRYLSENGTDGEDCLNDSTGQYPCQTLFFALVNRSISGSSLQLIVYPGVYDYSPVGITVEKFVNLSISKEPQSNGSVIFRCESFSDTVYNDLSIREGQSFSVSGITFQECGARGSSLYIYKTQDVVVSNCTFRNNTGAGLSLHRSQNSIRMKNCTFRDNIGLNPDRSSRNRPNFYIHTSGGLVVLFDFVSNVEADISDCVFINNTAGVTADESSDPRPHPYGTVGSGGGLTVRFRSATNVQVNIANCSFSNNTANYSGGGIYIPFIAQSENNSVLISNSSFEESRAANEYGGGIFVDVFQVKENNSVRVESSVFRNNFAKACGGGVGVFQEDTLTAPSSPYSKKILSVVNCSFDNNTALDGGSGVGMVSRSRVDQPLLLSLFENCTFTNNTATTDGTVLLIRFGAIFEGTNTFTGNSGGGIVLVLARMDSRGNLWFQNNSALDGAGVLMQEHCLLNLHPNTNITFLENAAESAGGALMLRKAKQGVDMRLSSLFNTFCFVQYHVEEERTRILTPRQWHQQGNVIVNFLNNTARHAGDGMYVSDVRDCSFNVANATCAEDDGNSTVYERSIFPGPPFTIRNNLEMPVRDVATEPDSMTVDIEPSLEAAPGDRITFVVQLFDQSGNRREGLWGFSHSEVHSTNVTHEDREGTVEYYSVSDVDPKRHSVTIQTPLFPQDHCNDSDAVVDRRTGSYNQFKFSTIQAQNGEIILKNTSRVNITCCHPGYMYTSDADGSNGTCVLNSSYPHMLRSDQTNRYIYLEPGYYAGFYNDTGQLYFSVALLPTVFQNCTPEGNRIGCLYKYDSVNEQCVNDRSGYMCGHCLENKGVDMTLRACRTCNAFDSTVLTIICVLILVFSAIVLVFNIGLPNDLKGFLFYAQVVGFAYLNGAKDSSWDFHLSRFLGFSLYLPICPFTSFTALWTAAFGFLPSILATLTVIAYIMCARCIKPLSQRTAFSGIWLLFLFVYKFTADTVANILKCVRIEPEDGRNLYAFYYDGTVQCFTGQHLILAIPSLILFAVVVALPGFVILISFKRYKFSQAFTDVITEGIKTRCRWWGGFDLVRRLLFIVVVTIFDYFWPAYTQLALCCSTLIVLGVLCFTKPYEKSWINLIEGLILLDLFFITIRFLSENDYTNPTSQNTFNVFSIGYLLFPFIYAIVNITVRISHMLWKKYTPMNAVKMTGYVTKRLQPQNSMGKPLLKGQKSFDLPEPSQTSYSGEVFSELESTVQPEHPDVDYSQLREELLDSYND